MNEKALKFLKNFSFTLTSNFISLIISTLVIIIIPKFISVEEYGYWQLYIFYSGYVGFLHFGWNDGIYLRYGGERYKRLDKKLFHSQFYMLAFSQVMLLAIIIMLAPLFLDDFNKTFIIKMTAVCMLIVNLRFMLLFVMQATNRIKEFSIVTIVDRVIYISLIVCFLLFKIANFKLMIGFDLIGKTVSLVYSMYLCKDIVFRGFSHFYISLYEAIKNINAGIKLMFANIASKLIIGVVRFGIERSWSVATFGKVSLTLSVSGFTMLFINAVGIILFPILRRSDEKKLQGIYITMRDFLMLFLLFLLLVYYPMKEILIFWLPQYEDGLIYMAMLFPMIVYEGKMALLINTYLKTLRKEKLMMKINMIALMTSVIFTVFTTTIIGSLELTVLSIVVILAFRSILAEIYLSKILNIEVGQDILLETCMTILFISMAWFIDSWLMVCLYFLGYALYIILKRNDILQMVRNLKEMLSK